MKVLGVDQSYTSTGLVVLSDGNITSAGRFVTDVTRDKPSRAWELGLHICRMVQEHRIDVVAIEGLAFGLRGDATRDLAGLQFVITAMIKHLGVSDVPVLVVSPKTVKMAATGSGKADKSAMIDSLPISALNIFEKMGVKKTTGLADLADAYWIAVVASDPDFVTQSTENKKKKKKKKRNTVKTKEKIQQRTELEPSTKYRPTELQT